MYDLRSPDYVPPHLRQVAGDAGAAGGQPAAPTAAEPAGGEVVQLRPRAQPTAAHDAQPTPGLRVAASLSPGGRSMAAATAVMAATLEVLAELGVLVWDGEGDGAMLHPHQDLADVSQEDLPWAIWEYLLTAVGAEQSRRGDARAARGPAEKYPWRSLEVGEMFAIPLKPGRMSFASLRASCSNKGRALDRKFTCRRTDGDCFEVRRVA